MSDGDEDVFEDFEEFVDTAVHEPASLKTLQDELHVATDLEDRVTQLEADLKAAKKALHYSKANRIPDMMAELNIPSITFNGYKCSVNNFVSGSLPKEEVARKKAIDWIADHDGAELIKTDIKAEFGRSGHNEALALKNDLEMRGYDVAMTSGVHAQTLAAWARERLKKGESIDTEVLGLFTGRIAKLDKLRVK